MSAIAKPLIHSTAVVGGESEVVNVDQIMSMVKNDIPIVRPELADRVKYTLEFAVLSTENQPRIVTWDYGFGAAALAARDAGYTAALALASEEV